MDPNPHKVPALDLPSPTVGQEPSASGNASAAMPAQPAMPEMGSGAPAAVLAPAVPSNHQPKTLTVATDDGRSDDLDQEWVRKAKAIIEKTKNDPFLESGELSKIKADYLKIRYNKPIKVSEDHA